MDKIHPRWKAPKKRKSKSSSKIASARLAKTQKMIVESEESTSDRPSSAASQMVEDTPIAGPSEMNQPTASRRKIEQFEDVLPLSALQDEQVSGDGDYLIISKECFSSVFESIVCYQCQERNVKVLICDRQGFAHKIVVKCEQCDETFYQDWTSARVKSDTSRRPPFSVNRALTEAFLSVGLGHAGMEAFSSVMGMPSLGQSAFTQHLKELRKELDSFKKKVLDEARRVSRELYELEDASKKAADIIDIAVTYDGTWQKRGFTSLYGLGFVMDIKSGLVLDYEILSKYCYKCVLAEKSLGEDTQEYETWLSDHVSSESCNRNYSGSSPAMEMEAASRMWRRSESEAGFRYTSILSDGDSKTYNHLQEIEPYGPNHKVTKEECLNHVSKRLYTGLKKIVADCKVKKITLGGSGAGQLTEKAMSKLAQYYRLALDKNSDSVEKMQQAVLATIHHSSSTDTAPNHRYCPDGDTSWCFFKRAEALGESPGSHKDMSLILNKTVFDHILPLYERLSEPQLLERCTRGGTQNVNECLHSVLWHKVPKEIFVSKQRLELGVIKAVAEFNMGKRASVQLLSEAKGVPVPQATAALAAAKDQKRVKKSESAPTRFQRKAKVADRAAKEKKRVEKEGTTYGGGKF